MSPWFCNDDTPIPISQGLGTDDRTLVRVMVTRCEVDMEDIKDKFYQKYRKHLGSFIKVSSPLLFLPLSLPSLFLACIK